jgi:hypothetical protein
MQGNQTILRHCLYIIKLQSFYYLTLILSIALPHLIEKTIGFSVENQRKCMPNAIDLGWRCVLELHRLNGNLMYNY